YNMAYLVAVSALFFAFPRELVALFTADAVVIDIGGEWLRILSYSFFVYGWWMVAVQAFNGACDTVTPTKINLVFFWLIQIPLFFAFPAVLVAIFTADAVVIDIGGEWLRILSYSFFVYGWWMVAVQAFNGAGDTVTPTKINLVFFWLIQIPLCWYLALQLDWQQTGVFWGVFVSETAVGLFTLWLFTRGRWKSAQV